jgi:hypothetical protein
LIAKKGPLVLRDALPSRQSKGERVRRYKNLNGNSGVTAYEVGANYIAIRFGGDAIYWYTFTSPGEEHVAQMKKLAEAGRGLAEYIATRDAVRDGYERKSGGSP